MISKSGVAALGVIAALGVSACNGTDKGFSPPEVGTVLNWSYESEDGTTKEMVTVVATGPDFAIFQQMPENSGPNDEPYFFAEFSGIDFASCGEDMLTPSERKMFADAWPLQVGAEMQRDEYKVSVEEETALKLGDEAERVFSLRFEYENGDPSDLMRLSPRIGTMIAIDWGGGEIDRVQSVTRKDVETLEIQPGYEVMVGVDVRSLEKCGDLLTEAKD